MSQENSTGARKKEYNLTENSEEVEDSDQTKRQCTSSSPEPYGLLGDLLGSSPKFVSLEDYMKAAKSVTNMILAHEIAVNKDFKLEQFEAPIVSLEKKVKDVVLKAYWDVLESELAEDPPKYTQAMVLLRDVKNGLLELLLPQHTKIRQQISEILDVELIQQQANAGTLDFQQYAQYVISVMGKLCAPVRDEKVASLSKCTNVVEVFRGILETIDLMKLDMANFTISLIRPHIMANSIQYEKKKFADFLELDQDGLEITQQWLKRHIQAAEQQSDKAKKINAVINDAYMELLEWDEKCYEFPETIAMDKTRIVDLKNEYDEVTLTAAVLLLTFALSGSALCSVEEFKQKIKNETLTVLKNVNTNESDSLRVVLEEIAEKLKHDIQAAVEQYGVTGNEVNLGNLGFQLSELTDKDHKIRTLLRQRMKEFLLGIITTTATTTTQTAEQMKIPAGFSSLQKEVTQLAASFLRLISHNRAVYEEYYIRIVEELLN